MSKWGAGIILIVIALVLAVVGIKTSNGADIAIAVSLGAGSLFTLVAKNTSNV